MTDVELVGKLLRAVLQSSKHGVALAQLQSDYRSLTRETIPFQQLGFSSLEQFLRSIPSVVRMERSRSGEVVCFAVVCKETAHIAQLVARQKDSKKKRCSHSFSSHVRSRSSLFTHNTKPCRQPVDAADAFPLHSSASQLWRSRPSAHSPIPRNKKPVGPVRSAAEPNKSQQDLLTPPATPSSGPGSSVSVRQRLRDLLANYQHGLWASALPTLFFKAFGMDFPQQLLDDLSLLGDTCVVEYPLPEQRHEAVLYPLPSPAPATPTHRPRPRPLLLGNPDVPPLRVPNDDFPSVLLMEASSTNSVIVRYVGEGYSKALDKLEEEMLEFYSTQGNGHRLQAMTLGQLLAVRVEQDVVLRAQAQEVTTHHPKVYYVDHGFSELVRREQLFQLPAQFLTLPFQATSFQLAGLESFSEEAAVLKTLEHFVCGRTLLAELVQRDMVPLLVVLYDTSQERDVNINAACLCALQDKSMENPKLEGSLYTNVCITNVCLDGCVYCQLPCRGLAKLRVVMEKIETYLCPQVSQDLPVSRPFCGKVCLARHKGSWSRVEITNLHGNRVLDVLFVDLGLPASVEVSDLREIPALYLRELLTIPAQAVKCCLAELEWGDVVCPDAVLWLREVLFAPGENSVKISHRDSAGQLHIYLFRGSGPHNRTSSINLQLAAFSLWRRQQRVVLCSPAPDSTRSLPETQSPAPLELPPPLLQLPPVGHNLDVLVSVVCHPGHFVLQPLQELDKLVVLMGEMILYYNQQEPSAVTVETGRIYAAKIDSNWHRVLVQLVLSNAMVAVYEADYGKHELVHSSQLRHLIKEFRQLPFQGIPARLAGVKQCGWGEEASMVFRSHVERRPLVAQIESVQEGAWPWERRLSVYLVDTSQDDRDVWIHRIIFEFTQELSKAV